VVSDDAVDLFGHRAVERAQPGLDMRDRQPVLGGDQRRGKRRVRVAVHEDGIGCGVAQDRVESDQHPARSDRA
jgi:hypothetical protein